MIKKTSGQLVLKWEVSFIETEQDFEKNRRKQFIARIATIDYDCIIMSHSKFEKISISTEHRERMINEQIEEISCAIDDAKHQNGERWAIKKMESQRRSWRSRLILFVVSIN
jgi:hypothetical protein